MLALAFCSTARTLHIRVFLCQALFLMEIFQLSMAEMVSGTSNTKVHGADWHGNWSDCVNLHQNNKISLSRSGNANQAGVSDGSIKAVVDRFGIQNKPVWIQN